MRVFHTTRYTGVCIPACNLADTSLEKGWTMPQKGRFGLWRQVRNPSKGDIPWTPALRRILPMKVRLLLLMLLSVTLCAAKPARTPQKLKLLSLEQLKNFEITTVLKQPQEVWNTPATSYAITQDDIRRLGATTLPELLGIIPGEQLSRLQSDNWSAKVCGFASLAWRP